MKGLIRRNGVLDAGNGIAVGRRAAGGDQIIFSTHALAVGQLHDVGICNHGASLDDRDSDLLQRGDVRRFKPGDLLIFVGDQGWPIERRLRHGPAISGGVLEFGPKARRIGQELLGHAATNDAGATDAVLFRHHDACAVLRGDTRGPHAARTTANDEKINVVIGHGGCTPSDGYDWGRSTRRTPSLPARIAVRTNPMNRPCSITPGTAARRVAKTGGSTMRRKWASKIQCPPSVTNALPSFPLRSTTGPEQPAARKAASIARPVALAPNGAISIGSGKWPSTETHFESSAITTMRADASATIFSRSNAPPPPLMTVKSGATSSAPSTVKSSSGVSSRVVSAMPSFAACARVASDVGTATTSRPPRTRSPNKSTKCAAVEPVPNPSRIPSCTNSSARAAAARFWVSASMAAV